MSAAKDSDRWIVIGFRLLIAGMIGCIIWIITHPQPKVEEPKPVPVDVTSSFNVKDSALQDCKVLKLDYMVVVRCPHSVTSVEYQASKNSTVHTVTVDGPEGEASHVQR